MKTTLSIIALPVIVAVGCSPDVESPVETTPTAEVRVDPDAVATEQQEAEIRALIEQLVFAEGESTNEPVYSPGVDHDTDEYRNRYQRCQDAFDSLAEYRHLAFPIMLEHLNDERQSINFRNHMLGNSVGDACYWNIYFQLTDHPPDYSEYGYQRRGRDHESHVKPYWSSSPFEEEGGLQAWLEAHEGDSYTQMQIACLTWLLEEEKKIGASDPESYFINILPLEIQLLKRQQEAGHDVGAEVARLENMRDQQLVDEIPPELLPASN